LLFFMAKIKTICDECGDTGEVEEGQYDDVNIVPCRCTKLSLEPEHVKDEG